MDIEAREKYARSENRILTLGLYFFAGKIESATPADFAANSAARPKYRSAVRSEETTTYGEHR